MIDQTGFEAGSRREPITDDQLGRLREAAGFQLPESYVELLRVTDGGTWLKEWQGEDDELSGNEIVFHDSERLIQNPYPFAEYVPGLFFIASDGGEAAFGLDASGEDDAIYIVHHDDLEPDSVVRIAPSLEAFFELLNRRFWSDEWYDISQREYAADEGARPE